MKLRRSSSPESNPPLTRERRKRILAALRAGEVLPTVEDAEAAVRSGEELLRLHRQSRNWKGWVARAFFIAWLTTQLVIALRGLHGYEVPSASAVFAAAWLFIELYGVVAVGRHHDRIASAVRRNREFLDAVGHPLPLEEAEIEAEAPRKRHLYGGLAAITFNIALFILLVTLPVMDRRGTTIRLVVFALIAAAAIAAAGAAIVFGLRAWRGARRRRDKVGAAAEIGAGAMLGMGWAIGAVNVLFFGA